MPKRIKSRVLKIHTHTHTHIYTHTPMFIAALFTIAKIWKQSSVH